MNLSGKVGVVTGGSRGIGAAVGQRLMAAGARVAVLDLDAVPTTDSDAETGPGPPAPPAELFVPCDISDEAQVVAALDRVTATLGPPAVAVLNVGTGGFSSLLEMSTQEWDRVMDINLRGTFVCLRECARRMVGAGLPGCIVVTSSISATSSERNMAHYDASKAAAESLVRVAARELGPSGIRVNAVAPGTTDTPLFASVAALPGFAERVAARTPLGRIGRAAEVAEAVVALMDLEWVTGQVLAADGGLSLFSPIDPLER